MLRIVIGFFLATLWLPIVMLIFGNGTTTLSMATVAAMFMTAITMFFAIPLFLYFKSKATISAITCVFAGFSSGVLATLIFWLATNAYAAINWSVGIMITAIISSIIFWVVGIWGNGYVAKAT